MALSKVQMTWDNYNDAVKDYESVAILVIRYLSEAGKYRRRNVNRALSKFIRLAELALKADVARNAYEAAEHEHEQGGTRDQP